MHHKRGFTLLETIVAVGVMTFGILGPLFLANQSIRGTREAEARLAATAFAQEGVEAVRNAIANASADYEPSDHSQWLSYVTSFTAQCQNRCVLDMRDLKQGSFGNAFISCPLGSCAAIEIYQDTTTGFFTQDTAALAANWGRTQYTREITVTQPPSYDEPAQITVTVRWPMGSVTLQEQIYNWFLQLS